MVWLFLQGLLSHLDLFAQQLHPERMDGSGGVKKMGQKWQRENRWRDWERGGIKEMTAAEENGVNSQRWRSRFMWWIIPRLNVFQSVPPVWSSSPWRNHLTVSDSLPLHPVPLHFPAWECSCAAAAILNYIGQWEIVCMLLLFWLV